MSSLDLCFNFCICFIILCSYKFCSKIVLLGKDKLNTIEVLISKVLIESYISHDEFFSVNNVLREYNQIKEKRKNPEATVGYIM